MLDSSCAAHCLGAGQRGAGQPWGTVGVVSCSGGFRPHWVPGMLITCPNATRVLGAKTGCLEALCGTVPLLCDNCLSHLVSVLVTFKFQLHSPTGLDTSWCSIILCLFVCLQKSLLKPICSKHLSSHFVPRSKLQWKRRQGKPDSRNQFVSAQSHLFGYWFRH